MGEEEVKHICKFCGQGFKNVRALCGHKRSHSSAINGAKRGQKKHEFQLGIQDNLQTSSEFGETSKEKGGHSTFCHKCDKGFKSFRALNGHMRLHSKRRVGWRSLKKDLRLPNHTPREKRSVRRYKINTCSIDYSFFNWNNFTSGTTSSASSVDEEELKEIASCLLMLAKGGFYSADNVCEDSVDSEMMGVQVDVESSCNDSDDGNNTVMEGVTVDDSGKNLDAQKSGYVSSEEMSKILGFNSDICMIGQEYVECGPTFNVQHEFELYGTKIKDENTEISQADLIFRDVLDSEVCEYSVAAEMMAVQVDVHSSCNNIVMKGVTVDDSRTNFDPQKNGYVSAEKVSKFLGFDFDICKIRQEYVECGPTFSVQHDSELYDTIKDENTGISQAGSILGHIPYSKIYDHVLEESKCEFTGIADQAFDYLSLSTSDSTPANISRMKHICKTCDKGFRSSPALGGHRLHCPRSKRSFTSETDVDHETVESQKDGSESVKFGDEQGKKRAKSFTCLVCSKAFGSGQALGGHMRAHFQANPQSCEKKNDAFDHGIPEASEGETSLNHVPNAHTLPALVPVA